MSFDYSKLYGRIREKFGTQAEFAREINMSERTLSLKLSGKRAWTQLDIDKAIKSLELSESDIPSYFFKRNVQNIEQEYKEAAAG